jgi:hypothetical protein
LILALNTKTKRTTLTTMANVVQPTFLTIVMLTIIASDNAVVQCYVANFHRALPTVHHIHAQVAGMFPTRGALLVFTREYTAGMTLGTQAWATRFMARDGVLMN